MSVFLWRPEEGLGLGVEGGYGERGGGAGRGQQRQHSSYLFEFF